MRLSLSTNWCNRRIDDGAAIAELALSLGFEELELGFHTTQAQVAGFEAMLDRIPVGSVHAFCPVPLSAPQGYPELYSLASFDEEARRMARLMIRRNVDFAAEMGADTVVLHAGRVDFGRLFDRIDTQSLRSALKSAGGRTDDAKYRRLFVRASKRRRSRGNRLLDVFATELDSLIPDLQRTGVTLALENMPYYEGFPDDDELMRLLDRFRGAPVAGWFDTGHARVRESHGWERIGFVDPASCARSFYAGMHLNDVTDFDDDHFAPGDGKVDFAALKDFARNVRHVVFEPSQSVTEERLRRGIEHIRTLWQ